MSKYYSSSIAFGANQTKTEKVVVSPTKIGDVTTDAVSGALTVDEVPTLDSLNPVSSDGVARAVIQAGAELPTRSSEDTGKVLTVKNSAGDLEWNEPASVAVDQVYDSTSANAQSGVAVASAVSGKQDTISDLSTIRSGAELGATAVQPGSLATVATSGSYNDLSNKPSIPAAVTVDQSYNASSTNPQSGTAVAGAIATVKQLPASTSADATKVLTVNAQGAAEWSTAQGGSSDVFIVEDSTTQGDVYTAYTSGKVLYYKASSGEMYYMSSNQFSTSSLLDLFGAYVGGYGTHATIVHFDAYINLANGSPVAPTLPFSSAMGNIETIQTPSPLPTVTGNAGKVLAVNSGATGVEWINNVPIEVVASLPASPTSGTLYIVTGA